MDFNMGQHVAKPQHRTFMRKVSPREMQISQPQKTLPKHGNYHEDNIDKERQDPTCGKLKSGICLSVPGVGGNLFIVE